MIMISKTLRTYLSGFASCAALMGALSFTAPQRASSGVYGDVNGDGEVDVRDINEIINIILAIGKEEPDEATIFTVNGVSFKMVAVEGGTFTMGATAEQGDDAKDNEKPAHQVTLSSYSIGETEVTQALWMSVMGSNPSYFNASPYSNYGTNLQRPVEQVGWDECQKFITELNALTGKAFRLPTEAEWEYAARGAGKSKGYKYSGSNTIGDVAWYWGNMPSKEEGAAGYGTQTVATKQPNELGLYDMSGNVWEWCQDGWGIYTSASQTNPTSPTSDTDHVLRGGDWQNAATGCRVSIRGYGSDPYYTIGLRLAL